MQKDQLALTPAIITIFGITGDLANRKLLPSLYHLAHDGLLPPSTKIVGVTRSGTTPVNVLKSIRDRVEVDGKKCEPKTMQWLEDALTIVTMDITEHNEYSRLKKELDIIEVTVGMCLTRLFYLAIPSTIFDIVVERLGKQDLNKGCQHGKAESRLLIEKPFGYDLASAEELIVRLQESFHEDQIYRIDHYLAKETVQNIMTFRFDNPLFSKAWDSDHISHIMVTAAESIGIEGRVAFYEQMGAMRDLIQSHLLQLVALVTMDKPALRDSEHIHASKEQLLAALQPPHADEMHQKTVRGQYDTYINEVKNSDSQVETYAGVWLTIDSEKWKNVPVLIRTGKALADKVTEITIVFADSEQANCYNTLTIRVQPNEGIVLDLRIKKPGFDDEVEHVQMDFCYSERLRAAHPDAYERVLVDALRGDKTLFATSEEVLQSWRISEPIIQAWSLNRVPLDTYTLGSWGPLAADELAKRAGISWLTDSLHICSVHRKNPS